MAAVWDSAEEAFRLPHVLPEPCGSARDICNDHRGILQTVMTPDALRFGLSDGSSHEDDSLRQDEHESCKARCDPSTSYHC